MSQGPKERHGPELKCGGPGICQDCTELRGALPRLGAPYTFPKIKPLHDLDNGQPNELVDDPYQEFANKYLGQWLNEGQWCRMCGGPCDLVNCGMEQP